MSQSGILNPNGPGTGVTEITGIFPIEANGVSGAPQTGAVSISIDASGFVTSVSGTANQIAVSPTVGAVVVSLTNGVSIGSYQAIASPTGGLIMPGKLGVGTSSPNSSAQAQITSSSAYNTVFSGTQTADDGITTATIVVNSILAPTNNFVVTWANYLLPTFQAALGNTIGGAATIWATASASGNLGTITELSAIHIDIGTAGGTITTGYGIFIRSLAYGTTRYGLHVQNPSGGTAIALYTANAAVGFTGTAPPSNGLIVSGQSSFGSSSPASTNFVQITASSSFPYEFASTGTISAVDGSSIQAGLLYTNTFAPTNGSQFSAQHYSSPVIAVPTTKTVTDFADYLSSPLFTGNAGTLTRVYGFRFDGGTSLPGGSIGTYYGGFFQQPTANATNKIALFSANLAVGGTGTSPPASGMFCTGNAVFGTTAVPSAPAGTGVSIVSPIANLYSLYLGGTPRALDGSNNCYSIGNYDQFAGSSSAAAFFGMQQQVTAGVAGGFTLSNFYGIYISNRYNVNSGTITNSYGLYIDAGTAGSGTIPTVTNLFVATPTAAGTSNICAAFAGTTVVGASAPDSKAILTVTSTTLGFLPPRMTTTQKNAITSPTAGLVVYDNVLNDLQFYNGSSWVTGGGVFSITGTANQITASASAGAVTLSIPSDFRPPGTLSLGGAPQGNTAFTITATNQYAEYITGTLATAAVDLVSIYVNNILSPATSFSAYGVRVGSSFTNPGGGTLVAAYGFYSSPTFAGSGTTTAGYGLFIGAGSSTTTVTTGYGIRVSALAYGTTRYGLYVTVPSGGSTNYTAYFDSGVGIGGANASSSTADLLVTCSKAYGVTINGTVSATVANINMFGILVQTVFSPTAGASGASAGIFSNANFAVPTGQTMGIASSFYANPTVSANVGTITNLVGFYYDGGSSGTGTITTSYGMLIGAVAAGTTRYGIYVNTPTGGTNNYGGFIGGTVGLNRSPTGTEQVGITLTKQSGIYCDGNITTAGVTHQMLYINATSSPSSNSFNSYCGLWSPTFNSSASGINSTAGLVIIPTFTGTGTIAQYTGLAIDVGSSSGAPTITTNYGINVGALAVGTTRIGLYVATPAGGTNSAGAFLGYPVSIGDQILYEASKITCYIQRNSLTGASGDVYQLYVQGTMGATSTNTVNRAVTIYANPDMSANAGTIGAAFGLLVNSGNTAGTVTTGYGAFITAIAYGTTRVGLQVNVPSGGTNNVCAMLTGNTALFTTNPLVSFGSGTGVLFVANAGVNPTTNPSGGGLLYSNGGAGTWRGSGGTVTTFGPAEPHCPVCGSDFGMEWDNPSYGGNLQVCMKCLSDELGDKPYIRWNQRSIQ